MLLWADVTFLAPNEKGMNYLWYKLKKIHTSGHLQRLHDNEILVARSFPFAVLHFNINMNRKHTFLNLFLKYLNVNTPLACFFL